MHSVLFVAANPNRKTDWATFIQQATNKLAGHEGVDWLGENVWMLNLEKSLAPLGWLISGAESQQIPYRILALESEPRWLPVGFDRASTLDRRG